MGLKVNSFKNKTCEREDVSTPLLLVKAIKES
jgi:hypothetical protein